MSKTVFSNVLRDIYKPVFHYCMDTYEPVFRYCMDTYEPVFSYENYRLVVESQIIRQLHRHA